METQLSGCGAILGILLAVLAAIGIMGVVQDSEFYGGGDIVAVITDEQNGGLISLSPGETLQVELPANATTGYEWWLDDVDETVLQQIGEKEYIQAPADENMVGVGGTSVWRFETVSPGQTTLRLIYARAWEENVEPAQVFEITVYVE